MEEIKFGVELEFTASVLHAMGPQGTFFEHLNTLVADSGIKGWKIEQDASCGNEIVSNILLGDAGFKKMMQVCYCAEKTQQEFGLSRITGLDSGIHFHFDANNMNHRQIRNVLVVTAIAEVLFYAMNPVSRFGTSFAAPLNFNLFQTIRARDIIDLRDIWFRSYMGVDSHPDSYRNKAQEYYPHFVNSERKPQKYDWTRYHGLNFLALFKHGTMEFRYAHGSFDMETVEMWYRLFLGVIEACINLKTRSILKCNFPFNMQKVKLTSLDKLQRELYRDVTRVISFLFAKNGPGGQTRLIQPTVPMMKFIAKRLVKFNPQCMTKLTYKKIMGMDNGGDAEAALELLISNPIKVNHGSHISGHYPHDFPDGG